MLQSLASEDPAAKQKRIAWSVATECAVVTKEDPVLIYERLMKHDELLRVSGCDADKT